MPESTACGNCGEPLTELASISVEKRQPCPKCGSTRRTFSVEMTATVTASASCTATLITYPKALVTIAQNLIDQGYFNIAIVTSHMACEIAAERAFDAAYAAKGLTPLGEAVGDLMNGYNLGTSGTASSTTCSLESRSRSSHSGPGLRTLQRNGTL